MIRHLSRTGNLNENALKQLYRKLSKETHPDLKGGDGRSFRKLKEIYEEALSQIHKEIERSGAEVSPPETEENMRYEILKTLYIYSVKFRGKYSEGLLDRLIELLEGYSHGLYGTFLLYRDLIFIPFPRLKPDADLYWTHSLFIQTIPQLVWYFNHSSVIYRRISLSYIDELKKRARKLEDGNFRMIFMSIANWLEEEMKGEKVIIMV